MTFQKVLKLKLLQNYPLTPKDIPLKKLIDTPHENDQLPVRHSSITAFISSGSKANSPSRAKKIKIMVQ